VVDEEYVQEHILTGGMVVPADTLAAPGTESVMLSDQGLGAYRKLVIATATTSAPRSRR
jgi:hypothetical protein